MSELERIRQAKKRAIERIFSQQTEIGCWISERITDPKSSNVDATAFMLVDLSTVKELSDDPRVSHGIAHLITCQNPDGGWSDLRGEPSRPTITSYILWALGKFSVRTKLEVERGVRWLERVQCEDSGWSEIVERLWEGGIRPWETQPWITISCIRGLNSCPQTSKEVIRKALLFLENAQRKDGSWEGRMGTDMALMTFNEMGLTIKTEMVRRGIDYELSFQRPDGFLHDAWNGETLIHMLRSLDNYIKLGVPPEDVRVSKMIAYLIKRKKDLIGQLNQYADLKIFKIIEDLHELLGF